MAWPDNVSGRTFDVDDDKAMRLELDGFCKDQPLDVLVIALSIGSAGRGTLDVSKEDWDEAFKNVRKTFYMVREAIPNLHKATNPHVIVVGPPPVADARMMTEAGLAYALATYSQVGQL